MRQWTRFAEAVAIAQIAALGTWLVRPSLALAAAAAGLGLAAAGLGVVGRRRAPLVAAAIGLAGALVILGTSWRVAAVERHWPEVRESLIDRASQRLDATLGAAVQVARGLADRGAALAPDADPATSRSLQSAVGTGGPESGVVVFDLAGRPRSWAGRHRLPPQPGAAAELRARMTPFLVTLEAGRRTPDGIAVGHVLLAADEAVPDRDGSVAAQFGRDTGSELEFYAPGRGPLDADVFDYCIPSCIARTGEPAPDTLFSVRTVPPAQGSYKLDRLARGGRTSAWIILGALAALLVLGTRAARFGAVALGCAIALLTPAGELAGFARLFSPVTYYLEAADPLTASAGALLVAGGAGLLALAALWRWRPHGRLATGAGGVLLLAIPFVGRVLASGVTPPADGADLGLWLAWELGLALPLSALVLAVGWLAPAVGSPAPWRPVAAGAWAAGVGLIGLEAWQPGAGWPWWFPVLWSPAILLAATSGPMARRVVASVVVAGTAAGLFTWNAVAHGRLALARADAARLGSARDGVALALLDRLGAAIEAVPPPSTPAELYQVWYRSPLAHDGYPAILQTWAPDGRLIARLSLADLDLPAPLLRGFARRANERGEAAVEEVARVPGVHAVLSVPARDGSVVTVGVGPRSRLVPSFRVSRFLARRPTPRAPYDMWLSEPRPAAGAAQPAGWRRDGRDVRGELPLDLPGGSRHLHVTVGLGGIPSLLLRGGLLLVLNLLVVAPLWTLGEAIAGRRTWGPLLGGRVLWSSYRVRLAGALAVFFIVPTVGFAAWMGGRLRADTLRSRDLVIRQALRDAGGVELPADPADMNASLSGLADRVGTDLAWYRDGVLTATSSQLLEELGLIDRYLPPQVYQDLLVDDALETTVSAVIAGRPGRIGYRATGAAGLAPGVVAAPRLADEAPMTEQGDLAFALLLVTALGLAAAAGLAGLAARSLARPVGALRAAAAAVGRGQVPPPLEAEVPEEFASVADAFARMAHDVRASQAALEAARQRTAAVLRQVATGVIALTSDLTVSVANLRAEQLLGVPLPADGRVRDLTPVAWAPVWDWIAERLRGGTDLNAGEFTVDNRRILVQASTLGADAGGCVVAVDDITELAHAVRVLAWGELARQVAHEIKNPLTPLRLGIQLLRRAYAGDPGEFGGVLERTSTQILAEIDRLDAVARAFARFGTPAAEAQAGPLQSVDVVAVARETAALYALGGGGETRVTLTADGAVRGLSRRDELKEVLVNLVENARNAGASHVELAVDRGAGGVVVVRIRDDGRGIPAADLSRLFEPKFSTTTSGTGLGLAICKRLVESWGGRISVERGDGKGTVATVEMTGEDPS